MDRMLHRLTRRASLGAIVAGCLVTSGPAGARAPAPPHPGKNWTTVAPGKVGLSARKLREIAKTAQNGHSNCLVVVRYGKIAGEWYWHGTNRNTTQDVYSMTKSISSTLVGIAQDGHDLTITQSASRWIPQWRHTAAQAVTVRDLLSMDSGRQWTFQTDYLQLLRAADRSAFAIGLPQQHAPGQVWAYNNAAVQTLEPVLRAATGQNPATFARDRLFRPLGMTRTKMGTDRAGNPQMFEGVQSSCRDMARLGVMVLNRGRWGTRQVVSSGWLNAATGVSSTRLNAGYGYLWWLNHSGLLASPFVATSLQQAANPSTKHGRIVPGAPNDLVWALGLGNQLVQVDPKTQTVVVRLGSAAVNPKPPTFGPTEASKVVTEAVLRR